MLLPVFLEVGYSIRTHVFVTLSDWQGSHRDSHLRIGGLGIA